MTSTDGSALTLVSELDDSAVLARLSMLAARSRRAEADVLIVLAEVDARGLYLAAGYSSLFDFVSRSLGYSEAGAYNRIGAARAIRAFPQALAYVTSGRLHLSGLTLIGRVATRETVDELLELCAGHSKREIEARLVQFADARKAVEPAPTEAALPLLDFAAVGTVADAAHDAPSPVLPRSPAPAAPPPASGATNRPVVMRPLQVRMTPKLQSLLERAKALLGHAVPTGETAAVLEHALEAFVERAERRRFGAPRRKGAAAKRTASGPVPTDAVPVPTETAAMPEVTTAESPVAPVDEATEQGRPEEVPSGPPPRRREPIPSAVRRAVFERDGGRCTFVGDSGHRCGTAFRLELHHIVAYARGGPDSVENLTLHCAVHNRLAARRDGLGATRRATR